MEKTKECRTCKNQYYYFAKNEKDCPNCRSQKSIRAANERWVKDVPKKRHVISSDAMGYKFFRKKYSAPNNVVRG